MTVDRKLALAARAAQMLGARWENDPLRTWEPNERQEMFLASTKSEVALLGANRSGKSDAGAACAAAHVRFGNPNPRASYAAGGRIALYDRAMSVWVVGLTERLFKEGIQPKLVTTAYTNAETHPAFIPDTEIDSFNVNEQMWRLKNGSVLAFKSADAGREVFQSAARDMVLFDEICAHEVYKEACLRVPGGNRRLLIRLCATLLPPLGMQGGVSWYFPEKIKPWWARGNHENTPNGANPDRFLDIFSMGMRHNKHIAPDEIARLEEMFPPGSLEHRIRIEGELLPSIGGTRAYSAYNAAIHHDPTLLPECRDVRLPLCLAVDFNVEPCIWVVGQYFDGMWGWFDEVRLDACNIPEMVAEFRRRYPTHGNRLRIYGDQTGTNRSVQTGKSHYYLMQEAFKGYPVPIDYCLPTRNPPVVDRINAVNRALMGMNGRVSMRFGPYCVDSMLDCEEVLRDVHGGIKKSRKPEDPYYQRTHASDAFGYAVAFTDPVPSSPSDARTLRHMPQPGFLNTGGSRAHANYPKSYDADRRLRFSSGGVIMPPRR